MTTYRTPDVYIEEIAVFPPSVAEVETAVPAFIGYTETAPERLADGDDAPPKPRRITSFVDFERAFGKPQAATVAIALTDDGQGGFTSVVTPPNTFYLLYWAVRMYFANGGGKCYIVSAGGYAATPAVAVDELTTALAAVALEDEPTLLVVPEAVRLNATDYASLSTGMLAQCGKLKDRFAIFDVREGGGALFEDDALDTNRGHFGTKDLKYGAAYYPFLQTALHPYVTDAEDNVQVKIGAAAAAALGSIKASNTAAYNAAKAALNDQYITLPPSGAVAGVYASTDTQRGVWKAPANISLANVIAPTVRLDNGQQDLLNYDVETGKSINAIRAFAGKGTLVWGARTLAGNDNEWRYVPVRRFFSVVEESVKKSTYWAVFEPNDANTWVKVRGMIESYLTQKWREGALAGATTKEAFFVRCGLGTTMDAQDVLEGRLNVEIGMAVVRPAEFVILKFSHKLQTS